MNTSHTSASPAADARTPRRWRDAAGRMLAQPMLVVGLSVFVVMLILCWVLPFVLTLDAFTTAPIQRLKPPSALRWFGTDALGRDEFSRVILGGMNSLAAAAATTIVATAAGALIGLVSGFYRVLDSVLMRICDGLMAFPAILLGIALMAALGAKLTNVVIAMSIVFTPHVARVVRSATLVIRQQTYVSAAILLGTPPWQCMFKHALPNLVSPLIVQSTFVFADALIAEAALSFIGAGIPAPQPSWGNMLLEGKSVIYHAWWATIFPGLAIVLSVLSINLLGDGLRDFLDPRQAYGAGPAARRWWRRRRPAGAA
jgi:peptide/nickel transport system permease protein